jgi:thioredoxin 1
MELITSQQLQEMKSNGDKLLVDFFASWCGPCKMLIPRLELLETKYPNVKFVKLDVEENKEYAMKMGLRSVPTVQIFNGEELLTTSAGVQPDNFYKDYLSKLDNHE